MICFNHKKRDQLISFRNLYYLKQLSKILYDKYIIYQYIIIKKLPKYIINYNNVVCIKELKNKSKNI